MYAIKQSFWDNKGNSWTKTLKQRYKTLRGAEKAADRSYRWKCINPATREVFESSSAEVLEVKI